MEKQEFLQKKRELNKQYKVLFGKLPCIEDYACTREEYLTAMQKAIEEKKELDVFLPRVKTPSGKDILI